MAENKSPTFKRPDDKPARNADPNEWEWQRRYFEYYEARDRIRRSKPRRSRGPYADAWRDHYEREQL